MSEPETAEHVHDAHECDEHEHHADEGDKELVAAE